VKLFFSSSRKHISWDEAKKIAYHSPLSHFSLSSMYEVIGEAVLPNNSKQLSFTYKVVHEVVFHKKNSFTSEAELCQTGP
jgi:hypothetical protein